MFPAQTSLIPVTVALTSYIAQNGFSGNYPYWYLGSTPVKYLIGPVVPGILNGLNNIFGVGLFNVSIALVIFSIFVSAAGWGAFTATISGNIKIGVTVTFLSLILPWHWFFSLGLSEVSAVFAVSFTGWLLYLYKRYTDSGLKINWAIALTLMLVLILLTNTTTALVPILSLLILSIALDKKIGTVIKRIGVIILIGWSISTIWYGAGYWLTILGAPSVGGKTILGAFVSLVNSLRAFVPVILVVVLVWWQIKPGSILAKFTLYYLVLFGSMTLFRLLADWDFWMDWTAWIWEVEVGIAFAAALLIDRSVRHFEKPFGQTLSKVRDSSLDLTYASARHQLKKKFVLQLGLASSYFSKCLPSLIRSKLTIYYLLLTIYILAGWYFVFSKRAFWLPGKTIEGTVEYRIARRLEGIVKPGETVFLSGTTAFWLNSFVNVAQVRGGRDEAAVDQKWRDVAWKIRQGSDLEIVVSSLRNFNVNYLVIHTDDSMEYYHDFKNPGIFLDSNIFKEVFNSSGDIIYKIN